MFYISCRGSGATQWIAQQLSKHKKTVINTSLLNKDLSLRKMKKKILK